MSAPIPAPPTITPGALGLEWVEAFNAHDLERILSHYREDVELTSPVYRRFTEGRTATARGKPALRRYFAYALDGFPDLRFTLLELLAGETSVCLRYHTTVGDRIAAECMEFDGQGRIFRVLCHYLDRGAH
jgi:ketosteroid isomerase-like protein